MSWGNWVNFSSYLYDTSVDPAARLSMSPDIMKEAPCCLRMARDIFEISQREKTYSGTFYLCLIRGDMDWEQGGHYSSWELVCVTDCKFHTVHFRNKTCSCEDSSESWFITSGWKLVLSPFVLLRWIKQGGILFMSHGTMPRTHGLLATCIRLIKLPVSYKQSLLIFLIQKSESSHHKLTACQELNEYFIFCFLQL